MVLLQWLCGLALVVSGAGVVAAPTVELTIDPATALPQLRVGGAPAMTATYAFWGADWAWAGVALDSGGDDRRPVRGRVDDLGLRLRVDGPATVGDPLRWRWTLEAGRAKTPVVGGGLQFDFDLAAAGRAMGEPRLLPGGAGWAWGRPDGPRLEMRFDPAPAAIEVEPGRPDRIRVMLVRDRIVPGTRRVEATLAVHGSVSRRPPAAQRFGLQGRDRWPRVSSDASAPVADLRFLNADDRPAGRRGFVRVDGDRLVFPDGSPARFWGTNLAAYALFGTPPDQIRHHARRLAMLGHNLVRIHHHDSPWVSPNLFGDPAAGRGTRHLDRDALDALHRWIAALVDEGVYVWLDLQTQRHVQPADGIRDFDELPTAYDHGHRDPKGFAFVNEDLQAAMDTFAADLLGARNPHTGRRLVDEPGLLAVQVSNEHDLVHHFGNRLLPDGGAPAHAARLRALADRFAQAHRLDADGTARTWEHGPAKRFLSDVEHGLHRERIARLRALGLRAPVATTSHWGDNPIAALPALTAGELVDVHSYAGDEELSRDPRIAATLGHFVATARRVGRPLTVSEWGMAEHDRPDRHALPLVVAAAAAHQGWDALMHYAYSQDALVAGTRSDGWSSFGDLATQVPMAAAALMYRQAHVREAGRLAVFAPTPRQLFDDGLSVANVPALRVAAERGGLAMAMPAVPELPWLRPDRVPDGARRIVDPAGPVDLAADAGAVRSDTGEITRDWRRGAWTVDSPRSQGAAGFIGGRTVALADVAVTVDAPHASVSVHSLDGRPIASSRSLLVAVSGVVQRDPAGGDPRAQPVGGELRLRAAADLRLHLLDDAAPLPLVRDGDGRLRVPLAGGPGPRWLLLRPAR